MAAAEQIRRLVEPRQDNNELAKTLIEQVLIGYDVNRTATHIAATTLGLLSPTTQFRNMKIFQTRLGLDNSGTPHLGSLELLNQQPELVPWPQSASTVSHIDTGDEIYQSESSDLIIMNPPFTRNSLRHHQFTSSEKDIIKSREKFLFNEKPVDLSSYGNLFLILAEHISKNSAGVVAAILPLATATNPSALATRIFLANRFHVETIVTSQDPERIYFSENTTISEMLLVCRRWQDERGPKPPTQIINLITNPDTPAAAFSMGDAIKNKSISNHGTIQEWPSWKIESGDWGGVQFLSPFLCGMVSELKKGNLYNVVPINQVANIGPDGRGSRACFDKSEMPDEQAYVAVWDHETTRIQSMLTTWDTYVIAKNGKEDKARKQWSKRGTLFLPHRMRLNTVRAVSVRVDMPAVSSAWTPCKPFDTNVNNEIMEKVLCLYLNSSFGILAILADRSNKTLSYPQFSMQQLQELPVPNFSSAGLNALASLAEKYDDLSQKNSVASPTFGSMPCPHRDR